MAITSESQILNVNKVYSATDFLSDAISNLRNAKSSLNSAKTYSSVSVFDTNEGNSFPDNLTALMTSIDNAIASLQDLKSNVESSAQQIKRQEREEYNNYLAEQEKAKAAEANSSQAVSV